jgi:hypothetical protein
MKKLSALFFQLLFGTFAFAQVDSLAGDNLQFDGATQFVDTRDTSWFKKFTVECWVKSPLAPSSNQGKGPVHYEKNFQINWDHVSGSFRGAIGLSSTNGSWVATTFGPLEGNTWYHLAGTYDGDTLRAYTNGRLVSQKAFSGGDPEKELNSLKIGRHAKLSGSSEYFQGQVDEVRVWNVERSGDEIRKGMFHPLLGNEPGLKHYYQFQNAHFQADSVRNLATGRFSGKIYGNPPKLSSGFPFGKGKTEVFKVGINGSQFFNSNAASLVSLQLDSANREFPLLFSKIEAHYTGQKPDSTQFYNQRSPFYILQALDTGIVFKPKQMRLDMNSLIEPFILNLSNPGDLKLFNRKLNSESNWTLTDTCSFIAFGSGHYIFSRFPQGQLAFSVPNTLLSMGKKKKIADPSFHFSGENGLLLFGEIPQREMELSLFLVNGRKLASQKVPPGHLVQIKEWHHFLPGLYLLKMGNTFFKWVKTD